jgi:caa(3)-type oxidase subunit IV
MSAPESHGGHHGPGVKAYLIVFGALSVFTAISFICNYLAHPEVGVISREMSFVLILSVAVVKAVLVGTYFMHLIVDWRKLFYLLIPAFILGAMMMCVLLPDIVLIWKR